MGATWSELIDGAPVVYWGSGASCRALIDGSHFIYVQSWLHKYYVWYILDFFLPWYVQSGRSWLCHILFSFLASLGEMLKSKKNTLINSKKLLALNISMVYSYNVLHMLLRQQLQLLKDQLISQKEILVKQIAQRLAYFHQIVGQMLRKIPIP